MKIVKSFQMLLYPFDVINSLFLFAVLFSSFFIQTNTHYKLITNRHRSATQLLLRDGNIVKIKRFYFFCTNVIIDENTSHENYVYKTRLNQTL